MKIVDTTMSGNSDASGVEYLGSGSGVTGIMPGVSPKHIPNAREKAALSVLYVY